MSQDFSLHMHTKLFDGKNTEQEMIDAAKRHGMKTIGISNHFIHLLHLADIQAYTIWILKLQFLNS